MVMCYLGLGSNLNNPRRQLRRAIVQLRKLPRSTIQAISSFYLTAPLGVRAQPMYYNLVIAVQTTLEPHALLKQCQHIENLQQRVRKKRWGSRTLDIDILLYGEQKIHTNLLKIPHPEMLKRSFVLLPLREVMTKFGHVT
jgi:2-amino-4-hydroxy-6-hydroxymethyldihydropteridine diphosphokinase